MDEIVHVAEIGTAGVAASVGALALGLNRVELLMIVFFGVTLGGQLISAMLAKAVRIESSSPGTAQAE
jgi:hypothetical protein